MTSAAPAVIAALEHARGRSRLAASGGDDVEAARWAERAWRLAGRGTVSSLELAASLALIGDERATALLRRAASRDPAFPVLAALAASQNRHRDDGAAQRTLHRLLTRVALDTLVPFGDLANQIAARAGRAGWIGWWQGRVILGSPTKTPETIALWDRDGSIALDWRREAPSIWSAALPGGAARRLMAEPSLLGAPLDTAQFGLVTGEVVRGRACVQGWASFPHDPHRRPEVTLTVERRGATREIAVADLVPTPAGDAAPFGRHWRFDMKLPVGWAVVDVRETASGRKLSPPMTDDSGPEERSRSEIEEIAPSVAGSCVLLVTHDEGGGIEHHVQGRRRALRRGGREGVVLRSLRDRPGAVRLGTDIFMLPAELPGLLDRLRDLRPAWIEYHQLRHHSPAVAALGARLAVPYDVVLHDYALLCPRITLIGAAGRYCGEPPVAACERCIADLPDRARVAPLGVAALRRSSAALLTGGRTVQAPSADIASRFEKHFPGVRVIVRPWESRPVPATPRRGKPGPITRVCAVGAINRAKGFEILLGCARDAAIRGLPIRFVVVGHTMDDAALIEAGVFVTGPYREAERAALIARQDATIGFLPSIWPEPWCYALTGLLRAGLPTVCFDIGAQAARVRAAGGRVLPLGMEADEINQHILQLDQLMVEYSFTNTSLNQGASISA